MRVGRLAGWGTWLLVVSVLYGTPLEGQTLQGPTELSVGQIATYSFSPGPPPGPGYSEWVYGWSMTPPYGMPMTICGSLGGEPVPASCPAGFGSTGPARVDASASACVVEGLLCVPGSTVTRRGALTVNVNGPPVLTEFFGFDPLAVFTPPATITLGTNFIPTPASGNDRGWPGDPVYAWSFGDGRTSSQAAPTVTFTQAGAFNISLRLSNGLGTSATVTKTLLVGRTCCADFSFAPAAPRMNEEIQFTNASSGDPISFEWEFGDGAQSTLRSPKHTYTRQGTFSVALVEHYHGGFQSLKVRSVTVGPPLPPVADFDWEPVSPQVGDQIRFHDRSTGGPTSWFWTLAPSGSTTQAQNPVYTCTTPETITVTLVASNQGGASAPKQAVIVIGAGGGGPAAAFGWSPQPATVGQQIQFVDQSTPTPLNYFWQFGDGGTSTLKDPVHTYQSPGPPPRSEYLVSLRVEYPGGVIKTAGAGVPVLGSSLPTPDFRFAPSAPKVDEQVAFTDLSTVQTGSGPVTAWFWSFDDGGTSTMQHPVHTFRSAGTRQVSLTVTNDAGSITKTKPVPVAVAPEKAPTPDFRWSPQVGIVGRPVTFTDTSTDSPESWFWEFGDGDTSVEQHPVHVFRGPGEYRVGLTATNVKGSNTVRLPVRVEEALPPKASFIFSPGSPGIGQPVTFTSTSTYAPVTFLWAFDDGTTATGATATHAFAAARTYRVTLTAKNDYGEDTAAANVVVVSGPPPLTVTIQVIDLEPLKAERLVRFQAVSDGAPTSFTWTFGDGGTGTGQAISHTYTMPGRYVVGVTATDGAHSGSASRAITIIPAKPPVARFHFEPAAPRVNEPVTFVDDSDGMPDAWRWLVVGGATGSTQRYTTRFTSSGDHLVTLIATNAAGDSLPHTQSLHVFPPPDVPLVKSIKSKYGPCFFSGVSLPTPFRATVDFRGSAPGDVTYKINDGAALATALTGNQADFTIETGSELRGDAANGVTKNTLSVVATNQAGSASPPQTLGLSSIAIPFVSTLGGFAGGRRVEANRVTFVQALAIPREPFGPFTITPPSILPVIGGKPLGLKETQVTFEQTFATDCTGGSKGVGQTGFLVGERTVVFNAHGVTEYTISPATGFSISKTSFGLEGAAVFTAEQPVVTLFPALAAAGGFCSVRGLSSICDSAKVVLEGKLGGGLDYVESYKPDGVTILSREVTGHVDNSLKLSLKLQLGSRVSLEVFGGGAFTVVFGWPEVVQGFEAGFEAGIIAKAFVFQWDATYSWKCRLAMGNQFSCFGRPPALLAGLPSESFRPILPQAQPHRETASEAAVLADVSPLADPATVPLSAAPDPDVITLLVREGSAANTLQRTDIGFVTKRNGTWSEVRALTGDDRGELAPHVAVRADGKAVALWQRLRSASLSFDDVKAGGDLPKLWREMEIVAAVYDPAADRWTAPTELSSNDVHDHGAVLVTAGTRTDPRTFAVWLRDPGNEMTGTATAPAQIVARELVGDTWGPERVLASGLAGVASLSAASTTNEASVVYAHDDVDLAVLKLVNGAFTAATDLTHDAAVDLDPRAAYGPDGALRVLWTRNGELVSQRQGGPVEVVKSGAAPLPMARAALAISPTGRVAVVWADAGGLVVARLLDAASGRFGDDVVLTRTPEVESALSPFFVSGDTLRLVGLATEITLRSIDRPLEQGETLHVNDVPTPGRVDLVETSVRLAVDLAALGVAVTTPSEGPSIATVEIANRGGLVVKDAPLTILGNDSVLSQSTVAGDLLPGETRSVAVPLASVDGVNELAARVSAPNDALPANDLAKVFLLNVPPLACLQTSASAGAAPLAVEIDASCSADPDGLVDAVRLDFGDGTGSELVRTTHTYGSPGTYVVTAVVRDAQGGVASARRTIRVGASADPRTVPAEHRLFVPVVAKARGQLGTNFVSDVTVLDADLASPLTVTGLYLPDGRDDTFPFETTIPPGQLASLTDVVARAFGAPAGAGWLRLDLSHPYARVVSRTYNDQPAGTAGVAIPGMDASSALVPGRPRVFLQHVRSGYRVNVGFTNTSGSDVAVTVKAFDGAGAARGERTFDLAPYRHHQANGEALFQSAGRLEVVASGSGVLAYVTTVDDLTGDAIYQTGEDPGGAPAVSRLLVPSVARLRGLNDTNWRTDLRLFNPTAAQQQVTLRFSTASDRFETPLTLSPGRTVAYDDAVTALFPELPGDISGLLAVESGERVLVTSRTYNVSANGTYGVEVPARRAAELLPAGRTAELIGLANDERYRCNFGFADFGEAGATVRVRAYDHLGVLLGEGEYSVGGGRTTQISRVFDDLGVTVPLRAARLSVFVLDGGPVYAYATTVDNRTGDGVLVEASK